MMRGISLLYVVTLFLRVLPVVGKSSSRATKFGFPKPAAPTVHAPEVDVVRDDGTKLPPYNTIYYFDQLIDHNDPGKGTFKMRYWFTWEWYQPGGPITLTTPGEANADGYYGYLTNRTVLGQVAQALHGASIVIEHRFWGESNPAPDLSSESLALLTLDQAVEDLVYFANNVKLPMPGGDDVGTDKAAWLLFGASYSGALTAWTMRAKPGVFWAGYASSAVVQAINYFWAYFEPIRQYMPQNCSADVVAVTKHFDEVFAAGTPEEQQSLKELFGMGNVTHNDDAAGALRNNLWDWQALQFYDTSGGGWDFWDFCDDLEVNRETGEVAPAEGFGLEHALQAWGKQFAEVYTPDYCEEQTAADCYGSYDVNQNFFTNITLGQDWRPWFWMVCNEFGWLQNGAPVGWPTIATRLAPPAYDARQCMQMFPGRFKTPPTPDIGRTNTNYGGWNVSVDRLFFANGRRDPWIYATMSSDFHPVKSTSRQPIFVGDGFHCSDIDTVSGKANLSIRMIQDLAVAYMGQWVQEWRASHPGVSPKSDFATRDPETLPRPPAYSPARIPEDVVASGPPLMAPITMNNGSGTTPHSAVSTPNSIPNAWSRQHRHP